MVNAVDLSQFTCLRALELRWEISLDEQLESLRQILSSISSSQLEELRIGRTSAGSYNLDSALAALARLRDIDDILARPQFRCLRH